MNKQIQIIGSGFSALSASCYLAKAGFDVTVLEKNATLGGRARQYKKDGFTFDIGPSWYWMPDVFERFFADFGKKPSDYYILDKLNPGYEVYFDKNDSVKISSELKEIYQLFENEEKGSSKHLKSFLDSAKSNYETAIKDLVYKPGISPLELVNTKTITRVTQFFSTIKKQVRKNIKSKRLIKKFRPNVVIGTGGFASGPLLHVASGKGISSLIQEQNSYPGITNKILSKKVNTICVAYDKMERFFPASKILLTGNPVRNSISQSTSDKKVIASKLGLDSSKPTLLILGGSLGARKINEFI